ncbi:hypothetical protein FACS1894129_9290 [Actinomycetota bacterium]|nr:hypothetical protein FACS1894129_9290 [Actinomycetota bacterium]
MGLPTTYEAGTLDELTHTMQSDKKNRNGALRFVVFDGFGNPIRLENPSPQQLADAYSVISEPEGK